MHTRVTKLATPIFLAAFLIGCQQQKVPEQKSAPAAAQAVSPSGASPTSQIAGTPSGTVMTPEYVAAVGRFAYIWGWPLVNNLNRSLGMKRFALFVASAAGGGKRRSATIAAAWSRPASLDRSGPSDLVSKTNVSKIKKPRCD